ncbi:MAG: S9 family peptidase [Paucibacter sp.]|nr:S9 family peptidase [Roseateles sp.]
MTKGWEAIVVRTSKRNCIILEWLLAGVLTGLGGGAAHAATNPPPAETFFGMPDIRETRLSPSGRYLAFTAPRGDDGHVSLFVMDLAPGGGVKQLAHFGTVDVTQVQWVNEHRLIFSVTQFTVTNGEAFGAPGLYAIDADGQAQRQLVISADSGLYEGEATSKPLDWNHFLLEVPNPGPNHADNEVLIGRYSFRDNGSPLVAPLWLNVDNGKTRNLKVERPENATGWIFDDQGEARVVTVDRDNKLAALWRAPGSEAWQQLMEGKRLDVPFWPEAVDRFGNLYVTHHEGPDRLSVLSSYDFDKKAPSPKPLVGTPGFDFLGNLLFSRKTGALQGVSVDVDSEATVWFDPVIKQVQAEVDAQLPGHVNDVICRNCGASDETVLVRSHSDHDPGHIYIRQRIKGEVAWRALGAVRKAVDPDRMANLDLARFKARDGMEIPVWITTPQGVKPGHPAPAVVLVHGGPWLRQGHWQWDEWGQFLASRGYLVIEPEFRGSEGYGDKHFRAGFKQWGRTMQDDVTDALHWAQQQGLATDRACIMGASYGGYSTLIGLIKDPNLYRCGIAWVALADLDLFLKGSWRIDDDIDDVSRHYTLPEMVGDAVKDADMLAEVNPLKRADQIKAPLLLAYGGSDRRVPPVNGERLRDALIKAGNTPQYVVYQGEGHGFKAPKNQVDFARRVEAFLAKNLGAPPAP